MKNDFQLATLKSINFLGASKGRVCIFIVDLFSSLQFIHIDSVNDFSASRHVRSLAGMARVNSPFAKSGILSGLSLLPRAEMS